MFVIMTTCGEVITVITCATLGPHLESLVCLHAGRVHINVYVVLGGQYRLISLSVSFD